jgi:hypothetical protein
MNQRELTIVLIGSLDGSPSDHWPHTWWSADENTSSITLA